MTKNKILIGIGIGVVILIIVAIAGLFQSSHTSKSERMDDVKQYSDKYQIPSQGDKDAKHEVVVFTDFVCPDCQNFHRKIYKEDIKKAIERGDVSYKEIQMPVINNNSHRYAKMTRAISKSGFNNIFYRYSETAYQYNKVDKDPIRTLKRIPMDSKDQQRIIDAYRKHQNDKIDTKELKNKFGVTATPTVFVDGKPVSDATKVKDMIK